MLWYFKLDCALQFFYFTAQNEVAKIAVKKWAANVYTCAELMARVRFSCFLKRDSLLPKLITRESMVSGTAKLINLLEEIICSCYSFLKETNPTSQSCMILLFYYLTLQQNDARVTSLCMQ